MSGAYPMQTRQNSAHHIHRHSFGGNRDCAVVPRKNHTSNTVAANSSHQAINPVGMLLCLADNHGVALLENLVYRDQGLERLDLVGKDGLPVNKEDMSANSEVTTRFYACWVLENIHFHASPESRRRLVVPRIDDAAPHMFPYRRGGWLVRFGRGKDKAASIGLMKGSHIYSGHTFGSRFLCSLSTCQRLLSCSGLISGQRLTNTSGLADIDGQIGLGPAQYIIRRVPFAFRFSCAYRLILAVGGTMDVCSGGGGGSGGMAEWCVALTDIEPGQRTDASGSLRRPEEADN